MAFSFEALRVNKPLRNLVLLGAATAIAVVASVVAVSVQERGVRAQFVPEQMYPGLETRLDQVAKIVYMLPRGMREPETITLIRGDDNRWRVSERVNYQADPALVQKALIGVSELQLYQPRTARKEWLQRLGLTEPENIGKAVRVQFFDKDGQKVAALLAGKVPEQTIDARGEGMIYVRRDGEDQSWLARGRLPLVATAQDWLDRTFLEVKRDDIKRVTLWVGTEKPVNLSRASKDENDFIIENIPEGYVTRGAPIVNGAATSIVDMNFDDAVPVTSFNFPDTSPQVNFELFDGTNISLTVTGGGGALWAKIEATGDEGEAATRAAAINSRVSGWAYKLPQAAGGQLTQSMDLLTHEGGLAP
ncbi:MAG: DUF4340 domain-containing protein [Parvibaculum sp.]|nr:DUF4340 domain-containing protein [Parvibaculum sp.]|tara:strand:+ start:3732 stop:4817 length:1086 start_codon:yes stop_codon:yes gene_type:complete